MSRIAFAWELGTELGHAMSCAALARALAARGHETLFIFRELHALHSVPELGRCTVFQAPFTPREGEGFGVPDSWCDILLGCGYANPADLRGLVAGWIELLRDVRADLVVADHAPTALLAARLLGLRRVTYSNGFAIPPRLSPLPSFRLDAEIDSAQLARREARALANVNAALAAWHGRPLSALHEQFETDEDFLCTFPELDHYGNRPLARYWGPRFTVDAGDDVRWPYGDGPRVLVYVHRNMALLDGLIDALVALRCRVAAYIPRVDAAQRARLASAQRRVADAPMRLAPLLADCDLCVNHGGNIAAAALMHGVPQAVFPMQYEQFITAVRLEQLGAGVNLATARGPADIVYAFKRLLEPRGGFRAAARAYARRYPAFSPAEQQRRIVGRIEQILAMRVPA